MAYEALKDALGAEGFEETREEGMAKLRDALLIIQGQNMRFEGSNRIKIKRMEIHVEYEFDGIPLKNYGVFADNG